jgi:capsular exopolysaccharide synthesis family protein
MDTRQEAEEYEARLADLVSVVRDTIRRRWIMLLAVAGALFVAAIILISMMTPQYSATAKVRLDPSRNPMASTGTQARAELAPEAIETEVTAIRSADLARAIVKDKGLANDPEFADALKDAPASALANSDTRAALVASAILARLSVDREKLTYVLNITFRSTNPVKAAEIANAFAQGYIENRTNQKVGIARQQSAWFQERIDQLAAESRAAEARAAQFRARSGIIESGVPNVGGGTIVDQMIAPLSSTLATAESDAAAARSALAAARAQAAAGGLDSVSEVLGSSVVADLRRQRSVVARNKSEVEARYGDRHPESIRVRDQLSQIDSQIEAEAGRVVASLKATAEAAQARAGSLRGSLARLETQRERSVADASLAAGLESEAAAKRALYDKMSQLSLDSVQSASAAIAQAEVIDGAKPPARPASPNKPLLFTIALIVAMAAGGATIAAQEVMSGGFSSIDELEAKLGLPVLAVIPKIKKMDHPADLLLDRPTSMFAEAFRVARTAVLGARGGADIRVIAITSSLPNEGKTTTALAFARTLAIANARTLLLECDVRRAALREIVKGEAPKAGLVELLHGEAGLDAVIRAGDVPNLDQILVVSPYFSAENLFGEGRMEKLLGELRDRYDYVVLDLPPLMGLADGRYLAVMADAVALVVKWSSTPVAAVSSAIGWLRNDGANPVGSICTQVDPSAHNVGGLYYYSKQYSDYYQEKTR